MAHRDSPGYRVLVGGGRRVRVIVVVVGVLVGLGVPVVVLGVPGLTAGGRVVRVAGDPAGLGVTGALPGSPVSGDAGPGPGSSVAGSSVAGSSGGGVGGGSAGAVAAWVAVAPSLSGGPWGIPGVMLGAYQRAARVLAVSRSGCHLSWVVLAGIGRVESGHAEGGRVDVAGSTLGVILGPVLDGSAGTAAIADTDHGVLDGDPVWDRAVGPMQFIPSSWRAWGVGSPDNIYDATLAAGRYLCAGGADLADPAQLRAAVLRYNHSAAYADVVLGWAHAYLTGVIPTPSAPGPLPPGTTGNGGRPITADSAPPGAAVARPTPPVAAPSVTRPPTTTSTPPPPSTTTTTPAPSTSHPPPSPSATTTPPPVTTTTAPVTTPLPSPSPTTDPPSTSAMPAGP
ncbi:MAG: hypothetical protein JO063_00295 [Pseudonocardiales bacterium]|nr:hypothetical protein [Pseudonocardiales bacterium]